VTEMSLMQRVAALPEAARAPLLASMPDAVVDGLARDWRCWARPKQLPPPGDWSIWLLLAGRGGGKTRAGAGWVNERAMAAPRNIALVARTPADARDYMIEGPGGLLANAAPSERPDYEPSKRRVTWPNGSRAIVYSDGEPEQTRGFGGDTAWLDEFCKWHYGAQVFDNLQFGMREASNDKPRVCITTTPRPSPVLRRIMALPGTVTVKWPSYDNRANLDPGWFKRTIAGYEGTRLGRQEIHADILDDMPGALWTRRGLDDGRVKEAPKLERVVVGLDPPATGGEDANEAGIVVCGVAPGAAPGAGGQRHGYVLDDWSIRGSPDVWGRRAVAAYHRHDADRIVAEVNQGGEMVAHVIRSVSPDVPITMVHATRGKYTRAEPISALFEQGRVHMIGCLPELEDQMVNFTPESAADRTRGLSPDRVDALVWALSELFPQLVTKVASVRLPYRYKGIV